MRKSLRLLASPRNLFVFEAAARLSSFTRAAEELGMQQPSVSAAIKQLEGAIGATLFDRRHRSVSLTQAGLRFYADVSRALGEIEASVEAVHNMGRAEHVTLNSSSAFSYYWMMPKLPRFRDAHPDVDLRLQTSDHEPDLVSENISLSIRMGDGEWPGCEAARIADEVIYPVASPLVGQSARNLRSIPNLLNERLIHLEEPIRRRPTWKEWFSHHGVRDVEIREGLRLNDYALVLRAAQTGEGFAFGWRHIVEDMVARKILFAREDWSWRTGRGIYLVWSKERALSENALRVRDWVLAMADGGRTGR